MMINKIVFFILSLILSTKVNSQIITKFIEPNTSISFDSTYFKIGERFFNTFWGTESYNIQYVSDKVHKTSITINSSINENTEDLNIDSLIIASFNNSIKADLNNLKNIEFDSVVNQINDFKCYGFIADNNMTKNKLCIITATKRNGEFKTDITFISNQGNKSQNYKVITNFLNGIKSYSAEQIKAEEDKILKFYTVYVERCNIDVEQFKYRPTTFVGIVKVKEPLQHKLKQVLVYRNGVEEAFEPQNDANIYIATNDKTKGEVKIKCKLVVLNSFGKKVKIPFEFKYTN